MQRIDTPNRAVGLFGAGKDGFKNGDQALGVNPTEFDAAWCNSVQEELAGIAEAAGLALDPNNRAQVLLAIEKLIEARSGNYALATGVANAYVVALNPAIAAYAADISGRFKVPVANTGACTLDMGAGPVSLVNDVGGALAAGDLATGDVVGWSYVLADNKVYITSLVQSQGDARYLLQNNPTLGLVETFGDPAGARDRRYYDLVGVTGMQYNGATINAEYMVVNNTSITAAVWAGRDVAGPCWSEVMTDAGQKLFYYAATAAAGVAPAWTLVFYADLASGNASGVPAGTIIEFAGITAPAGYLLCPTGATSVSRATYAALFAAIGTTWGAGDGVTTFGIPYFPADYAAVQASANVGTQTAGQVIAHTHAQQSTTMINDTNTGQAGGGYHADATALGGTTASTGGAANLAAGVRVLLCVKY